MASERKPSNRANTCAHGHTKTMKGTIAITWALALSIDPRGHGPRGAKNAVAAVAQGLTSIAYEPSLGGPGAPALPAWRHPHNQGPEVGVSTRSSFVWYYSTSIAGTSTSTTTTTAPLLILQHHYYYSTTTTNFTFIVVPTGPSAFKMLALQKGNYF